MLKEEGLVSMFSTISEGLKALQQQQLTKLPEELLYIPVQGRRTLFSTEEPINLSTVVENFLDSNLHPEKILLLQGDAGSGKSLFCQNLVRGLWLRYKEGMPIPVFISLPGLANPARAIEETFKSFIKVDDEKKDGFSTEQIAELKSTQRFIFVLDGYDEMRRFLNLYEANQLREWNAKTIITCRSQWLYHIPKHEHEKFFAPSYQGCPQTHLLQRYWVALFSEKQIDNYLKQYATSHTLPLPVTRQQLEAILGLKELISTPFLLYLVAKEFPNIVTKLQEQKEEGGQKVTRTALYDIFIENLFRREEEKLKANHKIDESVDPKPDFWRFCKNVARVMRQNNVEVATYSPNDKSGPWKQFFSDFKTNCIRSACPIREIGVDQNQYGFIHGSLAEYFFTTQKFNDDQAQQAVVISQEVVKQEQVSERGMLNLEHNIHITYFTSEEIGLLANQLDENSVDRNFVEINQLKTDCFSVLQRSKKDERYAKGAANAISVLNRAKISFSEMDFSEIRISKADLSYAILDHTNLQRADLREVSLRGAWLREADLTGANMPGVQWGELPWLKFRSEVNACAYSPNGEWLAAGCKDNKVYLYNSVNRSLAHTFEGHWTDVTCIAFGSNDLLVSGSKDNTLRLWDVQQRKPLHTFEGHKNSIKCVAFSPDGLLLVSGGKDHSLRFWDWNTEHRKPSRVLEDHKDEVNSVAFSANGLLASGSRDVIYLWSVSVKEKKLLHILKDAGNVNCVTFSPRGLLASASDDGMVRFWDGVAILKDPKLSDNHVQLKGHTKAVYYVAFNSKGILASASRDNTVRLWDIESKQTIHVYNGHGNSVYCLAFDPNSSLFVSGSADKSLHIWDSLSTRDTYNIEGHIGGVYSVAFSSGGLLASASDDKVIRLWEGSSGKFIDKCEGHEGQIYGLAFGPDGLLVSGSSDNSVRFCQSKNKEIIYTSKEHKDWVKSVVVLLEKNLLVSAGNKSLFLWDIKNWKISHIFEGHESQVTSAAFGENELLASGSWDRTVRLWDPHSKKALHIFYGHKDWVTCVSFGPNNILASGSHDRTIRLWNTESKQDIHTFEKGPGYERGMGYILCIAFAPNGLLASGSDDWRLRIWDVINKQCVITVNGFAGSVNTLAWRQKESELLLATGSNDSAVRLWQVRQDKSKSVQVILRWASSQSILTADNANLRQVQDLSVASFDLLLQRGARGKPANIKEIEEKTTENKSALEWKLAAEEYSRKHEYQKAVNCYDKALKLEHGDEKTLNAKAVLYTKLKEFISAIECYDEILLGNTQNNEIWGKKGVLLYKLGHFAQAMSSFEQLTDKSIGDKFYLKLMGYCWFYLGKLDKSLECFEDILKTNSKSLEAICYKGYILLLQKSVESAEKLFDQALSYNKDTYLAYLGKSLILLMAKKKYEAVKNDFHKAGEKVNNSEEQLEFYFVKGKMLAALGFPAHAKQAFEKGLHIRADYAPISEEIKKLETVLDSENSNQANPLSITIFPAVRSHISASHSDELVIDDDKKYDNFLSELRSLHQQKSSRPNTPGGIRAPESKDLNVDEYLQAPLQKDERPLRRLLEGYLINYKQNRHENKLAELLQRYLFLLNPELEKHPTIEGKSSALFHRKTAPGDRILYFLGRQYVSQGEYENILVNFIALFIDEIKKDNFWKGQAESQQLYTNALKLFRRTGLTEMCMIFTGSADPKEKKEIKESFERLCRNPQKQQEVIQKISEMTHTDKKSISQSRPIAITRLTAPHSGSVASPLLSPLHSSSTPTEFISLGSNSKHGSDTKLSRDDSASTLTPKK